MLKRSTCWIYMLLVACQSGPQKEFVNQHSSTESITIDYEKHLPKLVKVPSSFYDKMEIEEWEKLTRWSAEFEDVSKMNNKGIDLFINGLYFQTRVLYNSKFPEVFEIFPIRSRLKVVQMQAQKAKFYAETKQYQKLDSALDKLYQHYNTFLKRILSMAEETSPEVNTD